MKTRLPKELANFDAEIVVQPVLPPHLAWYFGSRVRDMCREDLRIGRKFLRPFTTLEIWLAEQGEFPVRSESAFFIDPDDDGDLCEIDDHDYWADYAKRYGPLLTLSAVPRCLLNKETLIVWLRKRRLSPPAHIFQSPASFVAEELPTSTSTYINPPSNACS